MYPMHPEYLQIWAPLELLEDTEMQLVRYFLQGSDDSLWITYCTPALGQATCREYLTPKTNQ